jgi:hypothetical protein
MVHLIWICQRLGLSMNQSSPTDIYLADNENDFTYLLKQHKIGITHQVLVTIENSTVSIETEI